MAEGLAWAGINEVPVVVTLYQRAGPSTGLPTRHEQGDLRFALHIGHGDFPRIVLASGDLEEVFYDTPKSFNYAERYQMPVIHIVDKAMANSDQTYPIFDTSSVKLDRGYLLTGDLGENGDTEYKRFKLTESGVSPRPTIGTKGGIYWNTGDEHTEFGHISEDPTTRVMMMDKRMRKLDLAAKEIPIEEKVHFFGPQNADITIVSWGSTKGAILDAMEWLKEDGLSVNFLQVRLIHPFPTEYMKDVLCRAKKIVNIEMNFTAQFAGVLRENTLIAPHCNVVKYNGRPMSCEEIYKAIKDVADGSALARVVLTHGA